MKASPAELPPVDVGALVSGVGDRAAAARAIGAACRRHGYFPVGGERTSGRPDRKEGIYFGAELAEDDPRVRAGLPLHGPNLFPELAGFRCAVLEYIDYGLLTILHQDLAGGLQVRSREGWIDANPIPNSFVCNIGDMLDFLTGGLYRSTMHRVRNLSARGRLSLAFFFDPAFEARVQPIRLPHEPAAGPLRWDGADRHAFEGTYGEYLVAKVGRVFPHLREEPS